MRGYQLLSQPSFSNAGGVGFFIQDKNTFSVRPDLSITESGFEALWVEVLNDAQCNLLCGVIYRHPGGNIDRFMEYLNSSIDKIHGENKLCVLMGDFNLDLLKFESHKDTDSFLNPMLSAFFQPQILQPTRITDHTATLIDIFLNSNWETFTISGNLIYDLTDHLPNFLIISNYTCLPNNIKMYGIDYSHFSESAFIEDCQSVNWEEVVLSSSDVNMFESLYTKLSEIIDAHVPVKKISNNQLKRKSKPWITPAVKNSIQIKNKLYKKFLKTKSPYYYSKFKYYRNKLNHLLKISKKRYYNGYFNSSHGNPEMWIGIKRIITYKAKCNQIPTKVYNNNTDLIEPKAIANAFNQYFANIGNNLAKSIPDSDSTPQHNLNNQSYDTFYLFPTSASEIEAEIYQLNESKATGPYSFPTKILKLVKSVLSKPLEILFNTSFAKGIVPDRLKSPGSYQSLKRAYKQP